MLQVYDETSEINTRFILQAEKDEVIMGVSLVFPFTTFTEECPKVGLLSSKWLAFTVKIETNFQWLALNVFNRTVCTGEISDDSI